MPPVDHEKEGRFKVLFTFQTRRLSPSSIQSLVSTTLVQRNITQHLMEDNRSFVVPGEWFHGDVCDALALLLVAPLFGRGAGDKVHQKVAAGFTLNLTLISISWIHLFLFWTPYKLSTQCQTSVQDISSFDKLISMKCLEHILAPEMINPFDCKGFPVASPSGWTTFLAPPLYWRE